MLNYTVKCIPSSATFFVELSLQARDELLLRLPAWLPGSYMIRDMAAEIQSLKVFCGPNSLGVTKIDKSTWRVRVGDKQRKLSIRYEVFAQDPSVRRAYLDTERAFLTFSSLCLCPLGSESEAIELFIKKPQDCRGWKVATELAPVKIDRDGFGVYRASNYDELIDMPMEIGPWESIEFEAFDVVHRIVLSGKVPPFDRKRLTHDVKRCVETVIAFFEPETHQAPFSSYTFFLNLSENLYGGLEHRCSTALAASFYDLPIENQKEASSDYARLLELFTHEYFHAWWIKRVKPSAFIAYELSAETYTELLWVFEGFTSYYDALLTERSQAIDAQTYLKSLASTFNRHLLGTAKTRQSLAESSFDAWIKYYKVRTNRSRPVTSYYDKGALVALTLDAYIREKSKANKSLDDVLRLAWKQYKESGEDYAGLDEEVISELICDATGIDVTEQLDRWVNQPEEPDYKSALKVLGLGVEENKDEIERSILGAKLTGSDRLTVAQLDEGGDSEKAGLCVGDELVAIDGIQVRKSNLQKLLERYADEKAFRIHVFRNGLLKDFNLKMNTTQKHSWRLKIIEKKSAARWLKSAKLLRK